MRGYSEFKRSGYLRFWIANNDTEYQGYVSENPAAQEGSSSAIFRNSRKPISSYCGLKPEATDKALGPVKQVVKRPAKVF